MKRVIEVDLSDAGMKSLVRELRDYEKSLDRKTNECARRLAEMGAVKASLYFSRAVYTGPEDHTIEVISEGDGCYKVRASGETVLFVEFGSGLIGYGHPEPHGLGPGTYPGKGHWNDPSGWWLPRDKNDGHSQHTYGNPPNMPMYSTVKELEQELKRVVMEVFAE